MASPRCRKHHSLSTRRPSALAVWRLGTQSLHGQRQVGAADTASWLKDGCCTVETSRWLDWLLRVFVNFCYTCTGPAAMSAAALWSGGPLVLSGSYWRCDRQLNKGDWVRLTGLSRSGPRGPGSHRPGRPCHCDSLAGATLADTGPVAQGACKGPCELEAAGSQPVRQCEPV